MRARDLHYQQVLNKRLALDMEIRCPKAEAAFLLPDQSDQIREIKEGLPAHMEGPIDLNLLLEASMQHLRFMVATPPSTSRTHSSTLISNKSLSMPSREHQKIQSGLEITLNTNLMFHE